MTKTLLKNIKAVPALPESVQEVERVYAQENSTFDDMCKAIEKDPLLTANILRIANSPMYGLRAKVLSVATAISLLGKDAVRTFVLGSAQNSFEIDMQAYGMTKEQFALACERQLALALTWLKGNSDRIALVAPAAFLVDIGRVIIAKTLLEDDKLDAIASALESGKEIDDAEQDACGAKTTDVTATLFHKWELDPDIIHIIRYSEDPDGANPDEKRMAAELKVIRETVLPNGEVTEESIATAKDTIEEYGLDLEAYEKALEKVLEA